VSKAVFESSCLVCSGSVVGIGIALVIIERNGKMFIW
jgi:hypothetical protein